MICICEDSSCTIPFGLCHCGCGQKTLIATRSYSRKRIVNPVNNTSGFKGVTFDKILNAWVAQICINKRTIRLGHSKNIKEAAQLYAEASRRYHGIHGRVE